jgi:hypothetical protein
MSQDTKVNLQKSVAFLYTNDENIKKKYRKAISFTIASKKNQIPWDKLNKDKNDLYKENYKPLKKEIWEFYKRWKDLPCSWTGNQHSKNGYNTKINGEIHTHMDA